jgi:uncharacterized membrane protein YqjE
MAHQPDPNDQRSIGEVIGAVVENIQELVRSEIRLAKTELREEAATAGRSAAMLVAGAVAGLYAGGLLLLTLVWALGTQIPLWVSALIITILVAIVAMVLIRMGKARLRSVNPVPERTVESVKEDVAWVKRQTQ